jgi:protocatechuate 3,4-dioxygenase beta subunit
MPEKPDRARRKFLRDLAIAIPLLPVARLEAGTWRASLVGDDEPGERLHVSGSVVGPDGKPASGVRLNVYHTDAEGYYTRPVSDPRRARIRGSIGTSTDGQYLFRTILPGHYPQSRIPKHIHVHVLAAGYPEHWIESFHFEGDPYLAAKDWEVTGPFRHVMAMKRDADGVWQSRRDIRLDPALAERNRLVDGWYRQ